MALKTTGKLLFFRSLGNSQRSSSVFRNNIHNRQYASLVKRRPPQFTTTKKPCSSSSFSSVFNKFQVTRHFHPSRPRNDVFFVSVPAFKAGLLTLTRIVLVILPFWWRWRLASRFPSLTRRLWQIPLFAMSLFVAFGLDQSAQTSRWRLLLMSEREEIDWSYDKLCEILQDQGRFKLSAHDPRVGVVKKVCDRLVSALGTELTGPISTASQYKPTRKILDQALPAASSKELDAFLKPSATTSGVSMPFRPDSSYPEKSFEENDWSLYVIDIPSEVNAIVLPTKAIIVYTGLLKILDSDEELLSAVLAHEVSHVTQRHAVENMGFLGLTNVFFDALRVISWGLFISFPFVRDGVSSACNYVSSKITPSAYSRKLEYEADSLGIQIMAKAGYDPHSALDLWYLLNELIPKMDDKNHNASNESSLLGNIALLRTHPSGPDRLKNLEQKIPKAMQIYNEYQKQQQQTSTK